MGTSSGSRSPSSIQSAQGGSVDSTVSYSHNKETVLDLGGVSRIFAGEREQRLETRGHADSGRPVARRLLGLRRGWQVPRLGIGGGVTRGQAAHRYVVETGDSKLLDVAGPPDPSETRQGPTERWTLATARSLATRIRSSPAAGRTHSVSAHSDCRRCSTAWSGNEIMNLNNDIFEQGSPGTNIIADRYLDAWTPTNTDAGVSACELHARNDRLRHHE